MNQSLNSISWVLVMCLSTMAIVLPYLSGLFIKVVCARETLFSTFLTRKKRKLIIRENVFRTLPARPFQFAPRKFYLWPITRYGNNIYEGVIDSSLNACCKLKLVFWKSVFKITLHTFPCFSFWFFNSTLKWKGFIIFITKRKVSHACTPKPWWTNWTSMVRQ